VALAHWIEANHPEVAQAQRRYDDA
jgi:hypothetical protein